MTEEQEYWQRRADRESHQAALEHEARMVAIEEIKAAALAAIWQWEEAGRAARMSA